MSQVQLFNFNGNDVRTIIKDGQPWWVAKDVCEIIGLEQVSRAMDRLDSDETGLVKVTHPQSLDKMLEVNAVNESGLYQLIIASNKPEARTFRKWITSEVLPSIRTTGSYSLNDPQKLIAAAIIEAGKLLEAKDAQIALLEPKAAFFDAVANSKSAIDMAQAAKVLEFGKGRTTLFRILREKGVLRSNNEPYQEYIDRGYFRVIEQKYKKPDGSTDINIKTLVYQKGLNFIRKTLESVKTISIEG